MCVYIYIYIHTYIHTYTYMLDRGAACSSTAAAIYCHRCGYIHICAACLQQHRCGYLHIYMLDDRDATCSSSAAACPEHAIFFPHEYLARA